MREFEYYSDLADKYRVEAVTYQVENIKLKQALDIAAKALEHVKSIHDNKLTSHVISKCLIVKEALAAINKLRGSEEGGRE